MLIDMGIKQVITEQLVFVCVCVQIKLIQRERFEERCISIVYLYTHKVSAKILKQTYRI